MLLLPWTQRDPGRLQSRQAKNQGRKFRSLEYLRFHGSSMLYRHPGPVKFKNPLKRCAGSTASGLHADAGRRLNFIDGIVALNGDAGTDTLHADDSGDFIDNAGAFTNDTITGLDMTGQIQLSTFEEATVFLGVGADSFTVGANSAELNITVDGDAQDSISY